ncbi:hypothetical protein [Streptomyces sp. NPDC057682]|uniref:hypothetical protein n=1 Tax=Streptomyces sp. NPDC057682 TaxID=3346210 RepID=UPI0036C06673
MTTTTRCEKCGRPLTLELGEYIERGRVRWSITGQCTGCPHAWCEQGVSGPTATRIRDALLAEHGPVRLQLTNPEPNPVAVLQALRDALHLPLPEARARATTLRETGLVGTRVEMEFLAEALRRRAIATGFDGPPVNPG